MEQVDLLNGLVCPTADRCLSQILGIVCGTGKVQTHGIGAGSDQRPGLDDVGFTDAVGVLVGVIGGVGIVGFGPQNQYGGRNCLIVAWGQGSITGVDVTSEGIAPGVVGDGHILGVSGQGHTAGFVQDLAVDVQILAVGLAGVVLCPADHDGPEVAGDDLIVIGGFNALGCVKTEAVNTHIHAILQKSQNDLLQFCVAGVQVRQTGHTVLGYLVAVLPISDIFGKIMPEGSLAEMFRNFWGQIIAGLVGQMVCDHIHDDLDAVAMGSSHHALQFRFGTQSVALECVDRKINGLVADPPGGAYRSANGAFFQRLNGRSLDSGVTLGCDGGHVGLDLGKGPVPAVQGQTVLNTGGVLNGSSFDLIAQGDGAVVVVHQGEGDLAAAGNHQLVIAGGAPVADAVHGGFGDGPQPAFGHIALGAIAVPDDHIAVGMELGGKFAVLIELIVADFGTHGIIHAVDVAAEEVLGILANVIAVIVSDGQLVGSCVINEGVETAGGFQRAVACGGVHNPAGITGGIEDDAVVAVPGLTDLDFELIRACGQEQSLGGNGGAAVRKLHEVGGVPVVKTAGQSNIGFDSAGGTLVCAAGNSVCSIGGSSLIPYARLRTDGC